MSDEQDQSPQGEILAEQQANSALAQEIEVLLAPHIPNTSGEMDRSFGDLNNHDVLVTLGKAESEEYAKTSDAGTAAMLDALPPTMTYPCYSMIVDTEFSEDASIQYEIFEGKKLPKVFIGKDDRVYLLESSFVFDSQGHGIKITRMNCVSNLYIGTLQEVLDTMSEDYQHYPPPHEDIAFEGDDYTIKTTVDEHLTDTSRELVTLYLQQIQMGLLPPTPQRDVDQIQRRDI